MTDTKGTAGGRAGRLPARTTPRTTAQANRQAATADDGQAPAEIFDVWSRTGSKYRTRSVVLLVVNVLLFAALGCFAFWLRTGVAFAPGIPDYWPTFAEIFNPSRDTEVTLGRVATFPISVEEVPMQI
ncbi:unnamed protein product, partial [marine sediment metagenome]